MLIVRGLLQWEEGVLVGDTLKRNHARYFQSPAKALKNDYLSTHPNSPITCAQTEDFNHRKTFTQKLLFTARILYLYPRKTAYRIELAASLSKTFHS